MTHVRSRVSPSRITKLGDNEVFVFGSNLAGRHGCGAAKQALEKFGAIYGKGVGPQGKCYAIPTKDKDRSLPIPFPEEIKEYVDVFIVHAIMNPQLQFLVTEIGCGMAKYEPKDIAPLFEKAKDVLNIALPQRFWEVLLKPVERDPDERPAVCGPCPDFGSAFCDDCKEM